jgi:FtsP/CotA-like multicopper oxidase with cupredoxin domain
VSSAARIGLVVAALAALVAAFVVLSPGADEEPATAPSTTDATIAPGASTPTVTQPPQRPAPKPAFVTIRVRAGRPIGGVKAIAVKSGDRARIQVTSPDTTDEVHLHGYDISRNLNAGGRVRFSFDADAEGIFELELEGSHTPIARLTVQPR